MMICFAHERGILLVEREAGLATVATDTHLTGGCLCLRASLHQPVRACLRLCRPDQVTTDRVT